MTQPQYTLLIIGIDISPISPSYCNYKPTQLSWGPHFVVIDKPLISHGLNACYKPEVLIDSTYKLCYQLGFIVSSYYHESSPLIQQ